MNPRQINDKQEQTNSSHLSAEVVDKLADELVQEYGNPSFREWYCSLIWQYGIERVTYWRTKAAGGDNPARLFSYFAKQAHSSSFKITGVIAKPDRTEMITMLDEYDNMSAMEKRALELMVNGQRRNHGQPEI